MKLAQDPRFVGGRVGMVGVLHTWTRQLLYHPHVHYIVTGGGLTDDGHWRSSRKDFLVPVEALSPIFRAKFRDALKQTELFTQVPPRVWRKDWVVHSEPVGSGLQAFQYLAPYIFRVALSNNRLRKLENGSVTFSYKDSATDQLKCCTLSAQEFIRRFLQHVLPNRFIKVRYYGLLSPAHRHLLHKARLLLSASKPKPPKPSPRPSGVVPTAACLSSCSARSLPEVAPHETLTALDGPLAILPALGGQLLSPSSPNSVSDHKKTSLKAGCLYLRLTFVSSLPSFSSANLSFPPPPLIPVDYSNSK